MVFDASNRLRSFGPCMKTQTENINRRWVFKSFSPCMKTQTKAKKLISAGMILDDKLMSLLVINNPQTIWMSNL